MKSAANNAVDLSVQLSGGNGDYLANGYFSQTDWSFELDLIDIRNHVGLTAHLKNVPEVEKNSADAIFLSQHLKQLNAVNNFVESL